MRMQAIRPVHVDFMPKSFEEGVLYISMKYRTASHRCCCGCGTRIVTPLRDTEYELIQHEGSISLYPSIGNWNHPCQSHYWIRNNRVIWCARMNRDEIQRGRAGDDALKNAYFGEPSPIQPWWRRALEALRRLFR